MKSDGANFRAFSRALVESRHLELVSPRGQLRVSDLMVGGFYPFLLQADKPVTEADGIFGLEVQFRKANFKRLFFLIHHWIGIEKVFAAVPEAAHNGRGWGRRIRRGG